jgi:hypothetical protein
MLFYKKTFSINQTKGDIMSCHLCRNFDDSKLPESLKNEENHTCLCGQVWNKKNNKWEKVGCNPLVTTYGKSPLIEFS